MNTFGDNMGNLNSLLERYENSIAKKYGRTLDKNLGEWQVNRYYYKIGLCKFRTNDRLFACFAREYNIAIERIMFYMESDIFKHPFKESDMKILCTSIYNRVMKLVADWYENSSIHIVVTLKIIIDKYMDKATHGALKECMTEY